MTVLSFLSAFLPVVHGDAPENTTESEDKQPEKQEEEAEPEQEEEEEAAKQDVEEEEEEPEDVGIFVMAPPELIPITIGNVH